MRRDALFFYDDWSVGVLSKVSVGKQSLAKTDESELTSIAGIQV